MFVQIWKLWVFYGFILLIGRRRCGPAAASFTSSALPSSGWKAERFLD